MMPFLTGPVWQAGLIQLWGPFPTPIEKSPESTSAVENFPRQDGSACPEEEYYYLVTIWDPVSRLGPCYIRLINAVSPTFLPLRFKTTVVR